MSGVFIDDETDAALVRDGFVVVPLLDPDDLSRLRAGFEVLSGAPDDPRRACITTFHTTDRAHKDAVDALVRSVLPDRLDPLVVPYWAPPANFKIKWPGDASGFGLHQDLTMVDERRHRSVEVWCPLVDTTPENGQLWVVPGSNRWSRAPRGFFGPAPRYLGLEERIVARHAVPVPVPAGTAIVFDHATIHFSFPNRTDRPRPVVTFDLIPAPATHVLAFPDPGGDSVGLYEADAAFWREHNPFTFDDAPSRLVRVDTQLVTPPIDHHRMDLLVLAGEAVDRDGGGRGCGAVNPGAPWCFRCGGALEGAQPNPLLGNVTILCRSCATIEPRVAASRVRPAPAGEPSAGSTSAPRPVVSRERRSDRGWLGRVLTRHDATFGPVDEGSCIDAARDLAVLGVLEEATEVLAAEWRALRLDGVRVPSVDLLDGRPTGATGRWQAYVLARDGRWVPSTTARCPRSTEVARAIPGLQTCGFSALGPGGRVPEHEDVNRGVWRVHLPVEVPPEPGAATITVGGRTLVWERGRALAFDAGLTHSVANDGSADRVTFYVEVARDLDPPRALVNRLVQRAVILGRSRGAQRAAECDLALNG